MSKHKINLPVDQLSLFSYDLLSEISVPSESMIVHAVEEYGTAGHSNPDIYAYSNSSWHALTKSRVVEQYITGSVTIDLSTGNLFKLIQYGNVTSFNFSNAVIGRQYIFVIERSLNYTFTWTAARYYFSFGTAIALTDPTTNGSSPAFSRDIITAICLDTTRLNVVPSSNFLPN